MVGLSVAHATEAKLKIELLVGIAGGSTNRGQTLTLSKKIPRG
jgi:hypothetical protein